jgi:hypothetical protein
VVMWGMIYFEEKKGEGKFILFFSFFSKSESVLKSTINLAIRL